MTAKSPAGCEEVDMRLKLLRFAFLPVLGCLSVMALSPGFALTQQSDPLTVGVPVTIIRNQKANRKISYKSKGFEYAPLLKLEWRLFRIMHDGSEQEIGQQSLFKHNDRLRISVRANQYGYLYVVHQSSPASPGTFVFPNVQLNDGSSAIGRGEEIVLPSNCPINIERRDCAFILSRSEGPEQLYLIFTRDAFIDLPNTAADAGHHISADALNKLRRESGQVLRRQKGSTALSELLTNVNTRDNEDIIETVEINKG
jgi:hypothetical protein